MRTLPSGNNAKKLMMMISKSKIPINALGNFGHLSFTLRPISALRGTFG